MKLLMKKISLLIDGDNISPKKVDLIYQHLAPIGIVKIAEVYGRSSSLTNKEWQECAKKYSLELKQTATNTKNSADFAMSIGGTEILHKYHHLDCFCIVSGDSDFIHLIETLKAKSKYIIGMGGENSAKKLKAQCDKFFNLSNSVKKQVSTSISQPITHNTHSDKTKRKEKLNKNTHLIKEITAIINEKTNKNNDFIKLSGIAGILGNAPRNLKCKDYGYKTWKELFFDLDCITTRIDELNQVLIKLNTPTKPTTLKLEPILNQKLHEIFEKVKIETHSTWWIHFDIYLRYLEKYSHLNCQSFGYKNWEELVRKSEIFTIIGKNISTKKSRPQHNHISYTPSYNFQRQPRTDWEYCMADMGIPSDAWDWYDDD